MKKSVLIIILALCLPIQTWAVYDLPNNDSGCPGDCRQIPWNAGSNQWNGGSIPYYTTVNNCTTAHDDITDDTAAINSCITACPDGQVVKLPAGTHRIDGKIRMPSNKSIVVRGHGTSTILKLYSAGQIGTSSYTRGTEISITSGYTKGSTSLVLASVSGLSVDNWVAVFEDADPALPVDIYGSGSTCTWCGENSGQHMMAQFVKINSINTGTKTITINRPMYYTFKSGLNPGIKKMTWAAQKVGVEDLKVEGTSGRTALGMIDFSGVLYGWIKNVETYNGGKRSNDPHVYLRFSHGVEIRDSYLHTGFSHSSGANYGIEIMWWNSDHKIENNRLLDHRHSIIFEGGGSGLAILYNYLDDNWETDWPAFITGDAGANHGPHPYMNLWEGNIASKFRADFTMGSSSHGVVFRNWFRGIRSDVFTPDPGTGMRHAIDIKMHNNYYSLVGNVLGAPSFGAGTVTKDSLDGCKNMSVGIYVFGCANDSNKGPWESDAGATVLRHGNYDYFTDGVANWDGGSDHAIANSLYYGSKPAWWCTETPWPPIGPDVTPVTNDIPAKRIQDGAACTVLRKPFFPENTMVK